MKKVLLSILAGTMLISSIGATSVFADGQGINCEQIWAMSGDDYDFVRIGIKGYLIPSSENILFNPFVCYNKDCKTITELKRARGTFNTLFIGDISSEPWYAHYVDKLKDLLCGYRSYDIRQDDVFSPQNIRNILN